MVYTHRTYLEFTGSGVCFRGAFHFEPAQADTLYQPKKFNLKIRKRNHTQLSWINRSLWMGM